MASSSPESPESHSTGRPAFRLQAPPAHVRSVIIALRLFAVGMAIASVVAIWRMMNALPWPIDCLIAAVATLAWAARFEREGRDR